MKIYREIEKIEVYIVSSSKGDRMFRCQDKAINCFIDLYESNGGVIREGLKSKILDDLYWYSKFSTKVEYQDFVKFYGVNLKIKQESYCVGLSSPMDIEIEEEVNE